MASGINGKKNGEVNSPSFIIGSVNLTYNTTNTMGIRAIDIFRAQDRVQEDCIAKDNHKDKNKV